MTRSRFNCYVNTLQAFGDASRHHLVGSNIMRDPALPDLHSDREIIVDDNGIVAGTDSCLLKLTARTNINLLVMRLSSVLCGANALSPSSV